MAADWFLPLDEVGLRCLTEANGVNVSYPLRPSVSSPEALPRRARWGWEGREVKRLSHAPTPWNGTSYGVGK